MAFHSFIFLYYYKSDMRIIPYIVSVISQLDKHKACGFDSIHTIVLRKCASELLTDLSKLYNKYIESISLSYYLNRDFAERENGSCIYQRYECEVNLTEIVKI